MSSLCAFASTRGKMLFSIKAYPNSTASSARNFGRLESLKALIRTTSSLRYGCALFRDLKTQQKTIIALQIICSSWKPCYLVMHFLQSRLSVKEPFSCALLWLSTSCFCLFPACPPVFELIIIPVYLCLYFPLTLSLFICFRSISQRQSCVFCVLCLQVIVLLCVPPCIPSASIVCSLFSFCTFVLH